MNCDRTRKLLHRYLDDELTGEARSQVRVHLDGCPACTAELDVLVRIRDLLLSGRIPQPAPGLEAAVVAKAARRFEGRLPRPVWSWLFPISWPARLAAAAAAVVLAVLGGYAGTSVARRSAGDAASVATTVAGGQAEWIPTEEFDLVPGDSSMAWLLESSGDGETQ